MPYMVPQITKDKWIEVDGPMGTEFIPLDVWAQQEIDKIIAEIANEKYENAFSTWLKDYCENSEAWSLSLVEGFGARLSAPGYMDKTEWSVFNTELEARKHLEFMYNVCSFCGQDIGEGEIPYCVCGEEYLTD